MHQYIDLVELSLQYGECLESKLQLKITYYQFQLNYYLIHLIYIFGGNRELQYKVHCNEGNHGTAPVVRIFQP